MNWLQSRLGQLVTTKFTSKLTVSAEALKSSRSNNNGPVARFDWSAASVNRLYVQPEQIRATVVLHGLSTNYTDGERRREITVAKVATLSCLAHSHSHLFLHLKKHLVGQKFQAQT